jgi:hypothetical protein
VTATRVEQRRPMDLKETIEGRMEFPIQAANDRSEERFCSPCAFGSPRGFLSNLLA